MLDWLKACRHFGKHQQQLSPHQTLRQSAGGEPAPQGSPAASHGSPAPAGASPATSNPASNPEWEDPYCAAGQLANGCRSVAAAGTGGEGQDWMGGVVDVQEGCFVRPGRVMVNLLMTLGLLRLV